MIALAGDLDFFGSGVPAEVATVFLPFSDGALAGFVGAHLLFLFCHLGLLLMRSSAGIVLAQENKVKPWTRMHDFAGRQTPAVRDVETGV
jgi:hypothetical protein